MKVELELTKDKLPLFALSLGVTLTTSYFLYSHFSKQKKLLGNEVSSTNLEETVKSEGLTNEEDEALIKEQLTRNISILGEEGMQKVRNSFVIVVGLGGVGSNVAHQLARAGVGHLRLIDFDQVSLSSLNRHATATRSDVGTPKVFALKSHLLKILPNLKIDARNELFSAEKAEELLSGNPDFVVDCIDNNSTKTHLIHYCHSHKLRIIVACGSAAKTDPSRIKIADLSETKNDPLSREMRRNLRKLGVLSGIPVVYSSEVPKIKLLPLPKEVLENIDEYKPMSDFRIRILPVLGTIPVIFGATLATYVINTLCDSGFQPLPIQSEPKRLKRLFSNFKTRERDFFKNDPKNVPLTLEDIRYIIEEIWSGRSAISNVHNNNKLAVTRWDRNKPPTMDNLIVLTDEEVAQHDKIPSLEAKYDPAFRKMVENKLLQVNDRFLPNQEN